MYFLRVFEHSGSSMPVSLIILLFIGVGIVAYFVNYKKPREDLIGHADLQKAK